ncbi:hypothetical protein [Pseudomonas izuensis]|uniref:Uncharacterized protein n=1 Tax=Pseudomonas izuensis TaxID=2684212 RepID=A0ABM7RMT0_9PSED|nr:hypothetical protein [Pseudomonas izuensis]BCX66974.1 hypothetical protein LAB08_R15980 [Pseudomonas izuensis]
MNISQLSSHSTTTPAFPTSVTLPPTQNNTIPEDNEQVYARIFNEISQRYAAFSQENEIGFQHKPGITGDIENITIKEIISILKHLQSDPALFEQCQKSSANSPLFTKLYLMSNDVQGWNLRLHTFSVKGSGLGGEDSPHYHRWTLASQVFSGGYMNVNYEEGSLDQPHAKEHEYSKYELSASKNQSSKDSRHTTFISRATMMPIKKELYAEGETNHFPINLAHSVETHASVMGTTTTLAHTAKSVTEKSYAFEKNEEIKEIPQRKIENKAEFDSILQNQITFLQILDLKLELNTHLTEARRLNLPLTPREEKHLNDYYEPNYVETSLLPALAMYQMESINGVTHNEFSEQTIKLVDAKLSEINYDSLDALLSNNQHDLFDKLLTVEVADADLASQLNDRFKKIITPT